MLLLRPQTQVVATDAGSSRDLLATIEHILPISWGGIDKWHNLALACKRCNGVRGEQTAQSPFPPERLSRTVRRSIFELAYADYRRRASPSQHYYGPALRLDTIRAIRRAYNAR